MSWRLKIFSSCRGLRKLYEPSGLDLGWRSEFYSAESVLMPYLRSHFYCVCDDDDDDDDVLLLLSGGTLVLGTLS